MSTDTVTRAALLAVARGAIEAVVRNTTSPAVPDLPILRERRGVFVTLMHAGRLRGCIGRIEADLPLSSLLPLMAAASAMEDPRFPPVSVHELDGLHVEISLLTVPVPFSGADDVEIGRHGLIVAARGRRGVLLPQVATEYEWDAAEFLARTCAKAGLPPGAWRETGTRVHTFETELIAE